MSSRVATDIGGTFTDLVELDEESGKLSFAKSSTTPRDLAQGVMDVIDRGAVELGNVTAFAHGTTVVINTLTERTGAKTGLVTTRGFRDILQIARGNRPDMYNLVPQKLAPFVPRRYRYEVTERVDRHGTVLEPLALDELDAIAEAIAVAELEAVAVCFLHAYTHPEHERACRDLLRERLDGVAITASSDVTREWREYERTSTAVLNSYVQPRVARYVNELEQRLETAGLAGPLQIMQSNAGTASARAARERPIYLVESGPAGGVVGAAQIGQRIEEPNVLYLDIGGTTAKCSLIRDGEPTTTTEYRIEWRPDNAGYPVMVPVVDIVEIGAGGGSIAWIDEGGSLRVGPKSAGAEPGPACYGRGGEQPTVTDAKLTAGVLDPDYFLGGEVSVSTELAESALTRLGQELGHDARGLANGIVRLLNANMINALKLVSVRRGYDPRDFVLVAAGGGGPMHAGALAAELRVKRVVIPPFSGVFSAWGMCLTDPRIDVIQTRIMRSSAVDASEIDALFEGLEREAAEELGREPGVGAVSFARSVDMRYDGQEHAVRVSASPGESVESIVESFHAEHRRAYTFDLLDTAVEFVTFHVAGLVTRDHVEPAAAPVAELGSTPSPKGQRAVDFDIDGVHQTKVYERDELPVGFSAAGPLVVEEPTTTTLVHPGQTLEVDEAGNLVIELA